MVQSRTDAFAALADADYNEPVLLVRLYLDGITKYLTSRAGTYGGQAYEELLKSGLRLSMGMDRFGAVQCNVGEIEIANEDDGTGVRFSDLLATHTLDNAAVEVDQAFVGQAEAGWLPVIHHGVARLPEGDAFDDRTFHLLILDEGQPARPELVALRANRIHKILGTRITDTGFPSADPDVIGLVQPEIYGAVDGCRALPVDAGMVDVLAADITAAATSLQLSDAEKFALFPATGTIQIETEQITYTGKTPATLTLTGLGRGANATTAAIHVKGRAVWEIQATYTYLVARHACKAVTNVKVDGILQASGYSVDLNGPTLIIFTAKPKRDLAVAVTQQPDHAGTVTSEQSPGAIGTTAEQTPGGINAGEGSHGHTADKGVHEYQSSPSVPAQFTQNTTFNFANTPKSGSTANWHIYVSVISGTWTWRTSYNGTILATLAVGDNFFTEAATPGTSYLLQEDAAGALTLNIVERDITASAATTADAASGISASMPALAGATATLMSTLSGSTAVSVARVTNVAVSPAEVEVGDVVTCDVEGYQDDGSGTYTGTPNALITNPGDQLRHILAVQLALTLANYVDATSFAAARAAFAAAGIRADWALYDQMDSAELLERLRWSTASRLFLSQDGKFKLIILPLGGTAVMAVDEDVDVLGEAAGGGPIRVGRTPITDMVNHVWLRYLRDISSGNYTAVVESQDAASQAAYRTDNGLVIENDFIRDETAAGAVAAKYLAHHKDPKWRGTGVLDGLPSLHLELCDPIALTCDRGPGGWDEKSFIVEGIIRTLCPAGNPPPRDKAEVICVAV